MREEDGILVPDFGAVLPPGTVCTKLWCEKLLCGEDNSKCLESVMPVAMVCSPYPNPLKREITTIQKQKTPKKITHAHSLSLSLFLSVSEIATGLGLCVCDLKPLQEAGEDVLAQSSRQFPGPQTATVELLLLLSSDEEETQPSTLTTTQHKKTDKTKNPKSNSCG